jgi:hypothetical protein
MKIRKLLLLAVAIACVFAGVFYFSQPRSETLIYSVPDGGSASQSYGEAMTLLNSGKDTYKAIALLKHSIALAPNIADYHEALASAYTDKAAYVYRALNFRRRMADSRNGYFKKWLSWVMGGMNTAPAGYPDPRPVEQKHHVYPMKDDGSPFIESDHEAEEQINASEASAETEWGKAISLTNAAPDQARLHYEKASACDIFGAIGDYYNNNSEDEQDESVDKVALSKYVESAGEIAMANRLQPNNAAYWEAAGSIGDDLETAGRPGGYYSAPPLPSSHRYYLKSLRLQPNNEGLWVKLSDEDQENWKAVQYDLQQANRLDPNNRFIILLYISSLYRTTHYERGGFNDSDPGDRWKKLLKSLNASDAVTVKQVERLLQTAPAPAVFNRGPYTFPYPPALAQGGKAATNDDNLTTMYTAYLRDAARCVGSAAHCLSMQGKPDEAISLLAGFYNAASPMVTPDHDTRSLEKYGRALEVLTGAAIRATALTEETSIIDKYEPGSKAAIADKALVDQCAADEATKNMIYAIVKRDESDYVYRSY